MVGGEQFAPTERLAERYPESVDFNEYISAWTHEYWILGKGGVLAHTDPS